MPETSPPVEIITACGPDVRQWIPDAARLRITVFREYPYLYAGDMDYERAYLQTYSEAAGSLFVIALLEGRVVGFSSGVPLAQETPEVRAPFLEAGMNPDKIFYFGESVLEAGLRGRGVGVRFFEEREKHARCLPGVEVAAFCAVERPDDHPLRPPGYVTLHTFWENRGFVRSPLRTRFAWQEIGESQSTPKWMTFWMKDLTTPA